MRFKPNGKSRLIVALMRVRAIEPYVRDRVWFTCNFCAVNPICERCVNVGLMPEIKSIFDNFERTPEPQNHSNSDIGIAFESFRPKIFVSSMFESAS